MGRGSRRAETVLAAKKHKRRKRFNHKEHRDRKEKSLRILFYVFFAFLEVTSSVFQSVSVSAPCFSNRTPKSATPASPPAATSASPAHPASLRRQKMRLFTGLVACFGQPCQKQPSTKSASLSFGKTKSGRTRKVGRVTPCAPPLANRRPARRGLRALPTI